MKKHKVIEYILKSLYLKCWTLLFAGVFLFSCSNNNHNSETQKTVLHDAKDSIVAPLTVLIKNPIVVNTDTCPKPITKRIPQNLKKITAGFVPYLENYSTEQGLPYSSIAIGNKSSICDSNGNIWFGTAGGGACRYDGRAFTNFTTDQGLANNYVYCITEDKAGNFWFGTAGGVSCYDGYSFTNFTTEDGLASNFVYCIMQDKAGNLYFGTYKGVSRYNGRSLNNMSKSRCFSDFTSAKDLARKTVSSIIEDKAGNFWFGTVSGALCYDGKTFTHFTTAQKLASNSVNCIMQDKKGNLWFGTTGGVSRYDGSIFTSYTCIQGLADNNVYSMTEDKAGNIWFGTAGGVSRYGLASGTGTFTNITTSQGLANNCVYSITEDKTGSLWFGTSGGGVSRYDGDALTNSTVYNGLSSNIVWCMHEDRAGNLWFGTARGLSLYDGRNYTNFTEPQGFINEDVNCVTEDKTGDLWFGTNKGAFRYDGKTFTNFTTAQGLVNNLLFCAIEDKTGNLWFGTSEGLSRYDGKYFVSFTTAHGLVNNLIYCIKEDRKGNIWIGTAGGVSRYDGNSFTNYTTAQGLSNNRILNITEDQSGKLWFGTAGGGMSRYDGKSFLNFTVAQGLADNNVYAIVQDPKGIIWAGTNQGLSGLFFQISDFQNKTGKTLIPAALIQANNEKLRTYLPVWKIYNTKTGYPIKDVNGGCGNGAMICDSKGHLWIGTGNDKTGLVRFDHESVLKNTHPLTVILQNIKVSNENVCWYNLIGPDHFSDKNKLPIQNEELLDFGKALTDAERTDIRRKYGDIRFDSISKFYPIPQGLILPHNHNYITFRFNAVSPSRHSLVRYQYMLEGYDKEWSPVTNRSNATYGNIFEGTHTFKVRALSPEGVWSSPILYTFKVLPPWWRTWWFYSLALLFLSLLAYLIYYIRLSFYRRRQVALSRLVKKRTSELERSNELLIEKQNLIKLQSDELQKKNHQLAVSNSSKDKFFSIIAHDLRNPFNTVLGFSEVLLQDLENYSIDDAKEMLALIRSSSQMGSDLLDNLLQWSRAETGRMPYEPVSLYLYTIVESNIHFLDAQAQNKNIQVLQEIDPAIMVMADENMLNTILRNLISNAIKFTNKNGLIQIKAKAVASNIEISVCDNGVGISERNIKKLFQIETNISTNGTASESGTGLGLILCKEFVEKHGGKIGVISEKGKGSEFNFTLLKGMV